MEAKERLSRGVAKIDMFTLSFGAMVGWGWVILSGRWVEQAGVLGACLAFAAGGIMCATVGLIYAEFTSAMPYAGGPVVFTREGLGYTCAWAAGWATCFAYMNVAAWEAVAIVTALEYLIPIPKIGFLWTVQGSSVWLSQLLISIALTWLIAYLNYRGVTFSVRTQTAATLAMAGVGVVLFVVAGLFGSPTNLRPVITDWSGFSSVVLMVPFMMVGFDVIPQMAEEADFPRKVLGSLLMLSVIAAVLWYGLVALSIGLGLPESARLEAGLPAAEAMIRLTGSPPMGRLLVVAGILGIVTSWNAFFMGASRILYAMGRSGMLPARLGLLDHRTKTPSTAIWIMAAVCSIAPLAGSNVLTWLANTGSLATLVVYMCVVASYLVLERKPSCLERPFRLKRPVATAVSAAIVTLFLLLLYTPLGPTPLSKPEAVLVIAWSALGFALYRKPADLG